jgi:hypothetical protein
MCFVLSEILSLEEEEENSRSLFPSVAAAAAASTRKLEEGIKKVNDKISDRMKHIMKISNTNVNIYEKTPTSQQNSN